MRKSAQEITDKKIIEEILTRSKICRIAMADKDCPYLLPFNYGYRDNCIYIHAAQEGKKIDLLKKNGKVCFEIEQMAEMVKNDRACKWSTRYRSVVGTGDVEIISDYDQKQNGLEIIMDHNGGHDNPVFDPHQVDAVIVLKLTIRSLTGKQSSHWNNSRIRSQYNIESRRLMLKELSWDDLENTYKLRLHPEVDEFNTLGIPDNMDETKEVMRTAIEDQVHAVRKYIAWSVFIKGSGEYIGEAGMTFSANRFRLGEIYYNFMPSHWDRGYGTETAKALIKFGFDVMKLHKVEAGVATENSRSIKVLEKSGMICEGLRRKILPIRGEWKDNYHYAIVETDPRDY